MESERTANKKQGGQMSFSLIMLADLSHDTGTHHQAETLSNTNRHKCHALLTHQLSLSLCTPYSRFYSCCLDSETSDPHKQIYVFCSSSSQNLWSNKYLTCIELKSACKTFDQWL